MARKSTLLKILSRITYDDRRAEIYGRLGRLLEVGTGFNAELTGRENIYLNGAIMGCGERKSTASSRRSSILRRGAVHRYPVKRYSSGMYVRLAFAVALTSSENRSSTKCSRRRRGLPEEMSRKDGPRGQGRPTVPLSATTWLPSRTVTDRDSYFGGEVSFGTALDALEHDRPPQRPVAWCRGTVGPSRTHQLFTRVISPSAFFPRRDVSLQRGVKPGEDMVFEIQYDTRTQPDTPSWESVHRLASESSRGSSLQLGFPVAIAWQRHTDVRVPGMALAAGEYRVMVAMGNRRHREDVDCVEDALVFRVEPGLLWTGETLLPGQGHFAVDRSGGCVGS